MTLSPGDRVDRYEVMGLLGAGGMGEVYRARDPKLGRLVALKILRIDHTSGTDGAVRLLREARAVAALSHPNILAIFDAGEVEEPEPLRGLPYIAMELVDGTSLRAYVGDTSVAMDRRIGWLRDVASALGAAHQAGIVHRDVKPENVMIRRDGAVKVLDFGVARRSREALAPHAPASSALAHSMLVAASGETPESTFATLTAQGALVGTPYFMAPEQLRGEPVDGRTDQFAWGVMAYLLLTGAWPWKELTVPISVLSQILSFEPPAPKALDPRIPAAVSDAVARALAKNRESRFATMEAVLASLEPSPGPPDDPAARQPPIASTQQALSVRPSAQTRGRRLALWGGLALLVGVGAASVLGVRSRRAAGSDVRTPAQGVTGAGANSACTSNRECVQEHGGAVWQCHRERHVCVELASVDCKTYADPRAPEADDVVWIGGMFPLSTDPELLGEMRATELARSDFAQVLGSSAERPGALHARPIGLVVCDEGADAVRAARHLVEDVEVPAVIGFRSTASALTTIPTVFLPSHVLSFVSISQAPVITRIPEPAGEARLVWRSTMNVGDVTVPLAHLISDVLEPAARGPGRIGARAFKVAVVLPSGVSHDFVESLFAALRFNGRSALENGANFRQFVYEPEEDAGSGRAVGELLTFGPDAIVYGGPPTFFPNVLVPLEARWTRARRPFYLTETSFPPAALAAFVGRDPSRRRRFLAGNNLPTTMPNAQLVLRYNLAFPSDPVDRNEAPQPSYDAFYVLAYATYALGDGIITGPALSGAIGRLLPPGPKVDVGAGGILDGFTALRNGPDARIDLNGAIGSLDFDPASGEAPIDFAIVCPGVSENGEVSGMTDSGLVYDAQEKRFVGALRCP